MCLGKPVADIWSGKNPARAESDLPIEKVTEMGSHRNVTKLGVSPKYSKKIALEQSIEALNRALLMLDREEQSVAAAHVAGAIDAVCHSITLVDQ